MHAPATSCDDGCKALCYRQARMRGNTRQYTRVLHVPFLCCVDLIHHSHKERPRLLGERRPRAFFCFERRRRRQLRRSRQLCKGAAPDTLLRMLHPFHTQATCLQPAAAHHPSSKTAPLDVQVIRSWRGRAIRHGDAHAHTQTYLRACRSWPHMRRCHEVRIACAPRLCPRGGRARRSASAFRR